MNIDIVCTLCLSHKPRYIRYCKCFYCEECKSKVKEICPCGGTGAYTDLTQGNSDELKYLSLDFLHIMKKAQEGLLEKVNNLINNTFGMLYSTLEIKSHQQKQLHKTLSSKNQNLLVENEELKRRIKSSQAPYEIKDTTQNLSGLDEFKYSTPRGGFRNIVPNSSVSKRPFDHEAFTSFFAKK
ncbi:hypothetical protein SteCoe_28210 [Stentor coeruleus]|uniref:Uncharacterized protein n=1 Tax=Stentor coeruleus TaxID=5963 RepID=A0A1R2B8R7_9CILI|nr:hypothetical protein SteCoe_28210 [Stentor coeruleus]